MEILNIILGLVTALLGFPIGLLLALVAKEELKPGKKYFQWMQRVLLILIVIAILSIFILNFNSWFILVCSLIFLLGLPTAALVKLE
jgi:hypothetical protein